MKLNIITPCTRPENLKLIADSINIPKDNYRWIVVFDLNYLPEYIPEECEYYIYRDVNSKMGNGQRNFALSLITDGHVYFNDDDTTMHHQLWDNIRNCTEDFISFQQGYKEGGIRLMGKVIEPTCIDSHNFISSIEIIGDIRWILDKYEADGIFANEVWKKSKSRLYIPKILSIYNSLK